MFSVAIDGPAGAGKSTVARRAAAALSFIYVDTGALYRAVGYCAAQKGADTKNAAEVEPLLDSISVDLKFVNGEQRVFANGEDVSEAIRTPDMAMHASNVSAIPAVRAKLLSMQRSLAARNNVIMDGRDIGTVVLPNAQVKIFLTASAESRAMRRLSDHKARGEEISYETLLDEIKRRDEADSTRATAPLKQADDAVLVDTTDLSFEESVETVISLIRKGMEQERG